MKTLTKHALGVGFGLVVMLTAIALRPPVLDAWMRLTGAVIPGGTHTHRYVDRPIRIMSVTGERWAAWDRLEKARAYHALIILPEILRGDHYRQSSNSHFAYKNIERWKSGSKYAGHESEAGQLEMSYDPVLHTVTIASQTYFLPRGNLFVVRYDENWRPEVTQLGVVIYGDTLEDKVVDAFKSAFPGDEAIQKLP